MQDLPKWQGRKTKWIYELDLGDSDKTEN